MLADGWAAHVFHGGGNFGRRRRRVEQDHRRISAPARGLIDGTVDVGRVDPGLAQEARHKTYAGTSKRKDHHIRHVKLKGNKGGEGPE